MQSLDRKDLRILDLLQQDATLPINDIAEAVGLSRTPCWRRVRELEKSGYIRKRVALLDRTLLGVPISVFVAVKTDQHNAKWLSQFRDAVNALPEIVEAYRLSGETDYLLRILVRDIEGFDKVYKKLIELVDFSDVSSSFSMEELKCTTAIPLA